MKKLLLNFLLFILLYPNESFSQADNKVYQDLQHNCWKDKSGQLVAQYFMDQDTVVYTRADFRNVTFDTKADFRDAKFRAKADFSGAHFSSEADFTDVEFFQGTDFNNAQFDSAANFNRTKFYYDADFSKSNFNLNTDFNGAEFHSQVSFSEAYFGSETIFTFTHFHLKAYFNDIICDSLMVFNDATFYSFLSFEGAHFQSLANFSNTQFKKETNFNNAIFGTELNLSSAEFDSTVNFKDTYLPERLFLYFTKSKELFDLSYVKGKGYKIVNPIGINFTKFKLNYKQFDLELDTTRNEINANLKNNIYESLLLEQKSFPEGYKKLDIEYLKLKYRAEGNWGVFLNFVNKNWWNYGYDKRRVFIITFIFWSFFVIFNKMGFQKINEKVYKIDNIYQNYKENNNKSSRPIWNQMKSLFWVSAYTSVIFFGVNLKFDDMQYEYRYGFLVAFIYAEYLLGLVCVAYIFNFVISK